MGTRRQPSEDQLLLIPEPQRSFDFAKARASLQVRAVARSHEEQIVFARVVTATVTAAYWSLLCQAAGSNLPIRLTPVRTVEVSNELFVQYAEACARLRAPEAFFQIGELYTALLPPEHRTKHGIYYTPPALVGRLLDLVEEQGIDWKRARVFDPACGGAAFAAYVAQRILQATEALPPAERLRDLSERLVGFDSDPFAAWLSAVLLDVICLPLIRETDQRLDSVIRTADTLRVHPSELGLFDLVIGNPPYGKITLPSEQRLRFSRSLFGHANLYGVFTDLAVSITRPGGLIAFVTPTSFLAGEYFKMLRETLVVEAPPRSVSFVSDREGVFNGVLQETMLTVARRRRFQKASSSAEVESLQPRTDGSIAIERLGKVVLSVDRGMPWLLPRTTTQVPLVRKLSEMRARLCTYGYRVATGQLVWNRHKSQFRHECGPKCHPVLWAECIQAGGSFEFCARKRDHRPFICVSKEQGFLLNYNPCVLVQRTTSKEQPRRLAAAEIPEAFATSYPGYVVENHVNMLLPLGEKPLVSLATLSSLINSEAVDQAFRCISGSVAVSAYELENLPLPDPRLLLARLECTRNKSGEEFEETIRSLYRDV